MTHTGVITNVNEIMSVASLLKCYFFLRTFMYFSRFNDPRAQRVCQMNGCKATSLFAIKSIIQENPYTLLTGMFLLSSIVGAQTLKTSKYAIQVFERPFNIVSGQDFDSYWNAIWLTIVTMTTVGYGDLYPKSFGGRVIGVIICIWGIFITSFFTVTLTNFLSFTPSQNKAYLLLQRLYWKELIQKESVKAVKLRIILFNIILKVLKFATLYKHKLLSKKQDIFDVNTKIDPKLLSSARTFRRHMVKFKETTRKMFNYNEGNTETQYNVINQKFNSPLQLYISKEVERLGCRVDEISDELDDQRKQQNEMNSKIDLILKAIQNNPNYSNTNANSGPFLQTPKGNEHNKSNLNKL